MSSQQDQFKLPFPVQSPQRMCRSCWRVQTPNHSLFDCLKRRRLEKRAEIDRKTNVNNFVITNKLIKRPTDKSCHGCKQHFDQNHLKSDCDKIRRTEQIEVECIKLLAHYKQALISPVNRSVSPIRELHTNRSAPKRRYTGIGISPISQRTWSQ